jgi:hypothetical protein
MLLSFLATCENQTRKLFSVMAGLDLAIHVFAAHRKEDVDARHKAGHDELR